MSLNAGEHGAETVEFALIGPIAIFLVFGIIYGLLAIAAQVTLTQASAVGARYASIPTDQIARTFPTASAVASKVYASAPFFKPGNCATTVTGATTANSPVSLNVSCAFPNPAGDLMNGMRRLFLRDSAAPYSSSITMTASATSRRE